jgi:hypothetical protein
LDAGGPVRAWTDVAWMRDRYFDTEHSHVTHAVSHHLGRSSKQ